MLLRLQEHPPDPETRVIDPTVQALSAAELSILFAKGFFTHHLQPIAYPARSWCQFVPPGSPTERPTPFAPAVSSSLSPHCSHPLSS